MTDLDQLKRTACETIDSYAGDFHQLSKELWNRPEIAYEEKFAHEYLTTFLEKHGFEVDRHYLGLETAFRATFGDGKPHVAVLSEYDALPEIGHACGHNLIAEVGVASGIAIKAAMEAAGGKIGKLTVLGTPAEENGGGKIDLIKRGAFEDFDFAGMCHPFPATSADASPGILAVEFVQVYYKGKPSHASAFPWNGINALDAAVMAFNNISCMRQQMKPNWRVHGVISNGGTRPNVIPEETALEYTIRTPTSGELQKLKEKITACFKAAAMATGCEMEMKWNENNYMNLLPAPKLSELFHKNGESVGVEFMADNSQLAGQAGGTDMGNVSHVLPSIHPVYTIGGTAINHTRGFTADSGTDIAQKYTLMQAKALAMTGIDVLCQPGMVKLIKDQFEKSKQADMEN